MLTVMDEQQHRRRLQALGAAIRQARLRAGFSQEGLGQQLGVSGPAVSKWESGKTAIDLPTLEALARLTDQPLRFFLGQEPPRRDTELEALGREVMHLVERRVRPNIANIVRVDPTEVTSARVPVINAVAASELMRHERQVEETIMVPSAALEGVREPVAFVVVGDCLSGQGIVTGDYLLVDAANRDPRDGEIVAARVNGEETVKCFYRVGDTVELRPDADGYEPIVVTERDELEIIGVYVGHIHIGRRGRR